MNRWRWVAIAATLGCSNAPAPAPPALETPEPVAATEPPTVDDDALFAPIVAVDGSWELVAESGARITVELRRYRSGEVTIARLEWTYHPAGGAPRTLIGSVPAVIAVGPGGVDLHESADDLDDDAVTQLLADGADLRDPPEHREAGTRYEGRVVKTARGPIVCFGEEPPGDADFVCPDTCYGQLCWSAKDGPVRLNGRWAPEDLHFAQRGYED